MYADEILVSVIVPIYNVQDYLENCIESIINQEYSNLEILLINDGSTDGSYDICHKYETVDRRVKVINKENGGTSDARNKGIDYATGQYIVFIDGDDYVKSNYIKKLLEEITKNKADVAMCGFDILYDSNRAEQVLLNELTEFVSGKELLEVGMTAVAYKYIVVWNKIYKKSLFNNLRFDKGKLYEDEYIHLKIFWKCKKVVIINESLYCYVQRNGSAMQSPMTIEKIKAKCDMHQERIAFYEKKEEKQLFCTACQMYCNWLVECVRSDSELLGKAYVRQLQKDLRKYIGSAQKKINNPASVKIQNVLGYISISLAACVKSIYFKIS